MKPKLLTIRCSADSPARNVMRVVAAYVVSRVNPTKPYKPRKLKTDQFHSLMRQAHKRRLPNPSKDAERKRTREAWERKNAPALKQRRQFVRKQRKALGLD